MDRVSVKILAMDISDVDSSSEYDKWKTSVGSDILDLWFNLQC